MHCGAATVLGPTADLLVRHGLPYTKLAHEARHDRLEFDQWRIVIDFPRRKRRGQVTAFGQLP
jgi:hypothetical protein